MVVGLLGLLASACSASTDAASAPPTLLTTPVPIATTTSTTVAPTTTSTTTLPATTTTTTSTTTSTTSAPATTTTAPAPTTTVAPATPSPPAQPPAAPPPGAPIAVAPPQSPTGAANEPNAWPAFDDVISDFVGRKNIAGASLAVAKDGKLVYAQTYGTSDTATGAPVTYSSRFNLASLSKVVTTATVMHLVEQGRIDLDARVVDVLAGRLDLPDGYDPRFDQVTVRQLLSHSSGLNPKPPLGPAGTDSCDELLHYVLSRSLIHDPGNYRYANGNFCLLGKVLESLGEGPWFDIVQRETLTPLGITDVALGHTGEVAPGDVIHRGNPVAAGENPSFLDALGPAGQLIATPYDLVRVLDSLVPGDSATPRVSPATFNAMVSPQSMGGTANEFYGYGLFVWDGGVTIGHTGSLPMVRSMVVHQNDGYTWCILVNGTFDNYSTQFRALMRKAIDATGNTWPDVDYAALLP